MINKNRRKWTLIALVIFALAMPAFAGDSNMKKYYVSPTGNDMNEGTIIKPFATLYAAQKVVREKIQSGLKSNIHVFFRDGTYFLNRPLLFGPADGGNQEYEVAYLAYPGEKPVLSGGKAITGWNPGSNNIWTAELPDVQDGKWWFRQLYADGKRLPRGRYPESGFLKIKELSGDFMSLKLSQEFPNANLGNQDTEVVVIENWSIAREIITSSKDNRVTAATPIGWLGNMACLAKPGMSVFLEYSLDFVKKPGQWYLGRKDDLR